MTPAAQCLVGRRRAEFHRVAADSAEAMPQERWEEAKSIITGWLIQEYRRRHGIEGVQAQSGNP